MSQRKLNTLVNNKDIAEKSVSAEKLSGVFKDLITYYNPSSLSIPPVSSRARRYNRPAYTEDIENGVVSEEKLSTSLIQALGSIESSLGITSDTTNLNSRPRKNNTVAYNSDLVDGSVSLEKLSNSLRQRIATIAIEAPVSLTQSPTGISITLGTSVSITPLFFTTGTVSITGTGPLPSQLSIVNNMPISLPITTTGPFTYTLNVTDLNATVPRTSNTVIVTVTSPMSLTQSPTGSSITLGTQVSITPLFFTTGTVSITGTGPLPSQLSIVNNMPIPLPITTTGTFTYTLSVTDQNATVPRTSTEVSIEVTSPMSLTRLPTGNITLGTPVSITPIFFTTGTVSITGTGPRPSPLSIVNNTPISLTSSITTTGTFTYTLSVTDQNATVPRTSNTVSIEVTPAAQDISWSGTLHTRLLSQRPTNDVTEVVFEVLTGNTLETATNLGTIGLFNNVYSSYQTDIRTINVSIRKIFYRISSFRGATLSIPLNLIQNGEYTSTGGTNLGIGSVFSVTPAQSTGLIVVTFVIS